ncbi:MAG: hypothetical protein ACK5YP_14410, partial [Betaproteobacteria bacterium]
PRRAPAGGEPGAAKFDFGLWRGGGHAAGRRGRGRAATDDTSVSRPGQGSDTGATGAARARP